MIRREIPATDKFPGMTEWCVRGRCFQVNGVGPLAEMALNERIRELTEPKG